MQMSLESNLRAVERDLSNVARKQLPFATSVALNETAKEIQKNETRRLMRVLDRPTPFTKKAYATTRATKRRLEVSVYAKPIQGRYLKRLEEGGTRDPKGRAIVIPEKVRLNRYGNLPRGAIRRNLANSAVFSGKPSGKRGPGIYKRVGSGKRKRLVKLVSYTPKVKYKPSLGFGRSAKRNASIRFPVHLQRALVKAFDSRRR